ncbi:MAG: SH3 domain-containing protein [Clostridiaceae bacterium]|nr:SH3 domain-containing protein [Clostridiaceae bacterium]
MKKALSLIIVIAILCTIFVGSVSPIAAAVTKTPFSRTNIPAQLKVTAEGLNVRSGPGTNFPKVAVIYRDQIVDCIGKLGTWYVIHLNNDVVGVASGQYLKPYYPPSSNPTPAPNPTPQPTPQPNPPAQETPTPSEPGDSKVSAEAQKMLDLINAKRAKAGVKPLQFDMKLMEVANLKAQDMVSKNYFSHTSPTYGSPFDMMKQFGISYKTAGENLAGNSSVEKAHTSLMNSEGHRKNILNANYNYIGIGIAESSRYGKIYVQMFIGK